METAKTKRYVNVTPHPINIMVEGEDGFPVTVKTIETYSNMYGSVVARVEEHEVEDGIYKVGSVTDLLPYSDGRDQIVSKPVAIALVLSGDLRDDIVFPDRLVRGEKGNVIGCESFGRYVC